MLGDRGNLTCLFVQSASFLTVSTHYHCKQALPTYCAALNVLSVLLLLFVFLKTVWQPNGHFTIFSRSDRLNQTFLQAL